MRKTILFFLAFVFIVSACDGPSKEKKVDSASLKDSILKQESKVYDSKQNRLQKKDAELLIALYEKYADTYPEDLLSADYLYKASDIMMNLKKPVQTIALFDRIMNDYPEFEKVPAVLFLKAFVYEDQLKDYTNAKKYYELFIDRYPDSDFADDAEVSLKNLGKSPEELIMEFEKEQESN